jgi:hypothetical protein
MRFDTEPLTDGNGNPITAGTVTHEVLSLDRSTTHIAAGAMSHVASGVWRRDEPTATVNLIPTTTRKVRRRVKVGSPVIATIERVEDVAIRVDRTS